MIIDPTSLSPKEAYNAMLVAAYILRKAAQKSRDDKQPGKGSEMACIAATLTAQARLLRLLATYEWVWPWAELQQTNGLQIPDLPADPGGPSW